ncbi:hypothetical protein MVEN_02426700 [Mycena venus]|uniref:Uncharacterized protein n=1 Tax=Mycena venus TaxID=2733690 RepID=A0A8H6WY78_9AGAR|nr:hypothetical protein MVEN_02426700 [Mycena venus]
MENTESLSDFGKRFFPGEPLPLLCPPPSHPGRLILAILTAFLFLHFFLDPVLTYCTGITAERAQEISDGLARDRAFARLEELYAPAVLKLRIVDPHGTVFIELERLQSFEAFLAKNPYLVASSSASVVDASDHPLANRTAPLDDDILHSSLVDGTTANSRSSIEALANAPRSGAFPSQHPSSASGLPLILGVVVMFMLTGAFIPIARAWRPENQTLNAGRVVVGEEATINEPALAHDANVLQPCAEANSSEETALPAVPSPAVEPAERVCAEVTEADLAPLSPTKSAERACRPDRERVRTEAPVTPPHTSERVRTHSAPGHPEVASDDETAVADPAPVDIVDRRLRPDRERVRTEVAATPSRASDRVRTRSAPGDPLVPASPTPAGAAVCRILPLSPMRVPRAVTSPTPAPSPPTVPVVRPAVRLSPIAEFTMTAMLDIPGALLYQTPTPAPTPPSNVIYATAGLPAPVLSTVPEQPQRTRRGSHIVYHGRSGAPPRPVTQHLRLPRRPHLSQNSFQGPHYQHSAAANIHHLTPAHMHGYRANPGPAQRRAQGAW